MQKIMNDFEQYLQTVFEGQTIPGELKEAMEYSLFAGGKRIRPLLCFATASLDARNNISMVFPLAAAIEMVHTYSLIHDDLPAMDDDDIRRGKPSNHKQFGEALAILAGDGLLSHSFFILQTLAIKPETVIEITKLFAQTIGVSGMVAGQVDDIANDLASDVWLADLEHVQSNKTGKLFACAMIGTAQVYAYPAEVMKIIDDLWKQIGKLFQAVDDYLDDDPTTGKTVGIDALNEKVTLVTILGKDGLRAHIHKLTTKSNECLATLKEAGYQTTNLEEILLQIIAKVL